MFYYEHNFLTVFLFIRYSKLNWFSDPTKSSLVLTIFIFCQRWC